MKRFQCSHGGEHLAVLERVRTDGLDQREAGRHEDAADESEEQQDRR